MPKAACSDAEFVELFEKFGGTEMARRLKIDLRSVQHRRERLEKKLQRRLVSPNALPTTGRMIHPNLAQHESLINLKVWDGVVLIGSDSHYWPGAPSTAHRAFVKFCKMMKPAVVIKNGDELDGAKISRHLAIGWEHRPSLIDEMETTKERLDEITLAVGKARRIWPLGNHDARFETRLANVAPEYAKIHGVHLKDHFPDWETCWMVLINDDVVVKHRFKSGIHAPHNNTMWAGKTIITGHLHSLKVMPISDYNGTRWGVDCGCIAEPYSAPFNDYTELSPVNWRSGFIVLTFVSGKCLWPEIVSVVEQGVVDFRGKLIDV